MLTLHLNQGRSSSLLIISPSTCLNNLINLINLIQPAGPRAESARAVTGRRCPHSGTGQDFLARNGPNRTKTAVTRQQSERFGRAQRLNGANAEGYKRPVDKNRGPISKNGFLAQKKEHFLILTMFRPRPGGVVKRKKYPFPK